MTMELPKSLSSNIAFLLTSVALQYRVMFDREMQPLGLTRSQWWVVAHVYYFDGISQAKLALLLDVDKSSVARLMTRLEKKKWIVRRPDSSDKRAMKVFLTPHIHRLMQDITALSDFLVKQSIGRLSKASVKQMQNGLRQIGDSLDAMIDVTSTDTIVMRRRIQKDLLGIDK